MSLTQLLNVIGGVPRRRADPHRALLSIETLEARQLPAGDLTIVNGVLADIAVDQANSVNVAASFFVENVGDQTIMADDVVFQAFLSADQVFGNGDDFAAGGNSADLTILAGASVNRVISGTPALSEYLASNFLLIKVDVSDVAAEGNENNNVIAIPLPRLPLIDTSDGQTTGITKKAVVVDPLLTFTDADTLDFNGASLRVSVANDSADNNVLSLKKTKTAAGTLRRVQGELRLGKNVIGSITGGTNAEPLNINFNSHVTAQDIRTIASAITLAGKKGVVGLRTVQFHVVEATVVTGPISTRQVLLS